ncbi:MAG: hypothetical protein QOH37_3218 [Nocardioidaceae bacterium]|nr:hypothetical protein [Nocardioidaceae bacterium]
MGVRARAAAPIAAALVLSGCGWFGPSSEPEVETGPAVVNAPYACPTIGPDQVATPGAKDLPAGAVAARLCVSDRPGPFLPPADDLTQHVDSLVRIVNRQRIIGAAVPGARDTRNTGCGGPSDPSFAIVFRYAHGTRTVSGNPLGCTAGLEVQVGNGMREGSRRVWEAYLRLLAKQRGEEVHSAGAHTRALPCSRLSRSVPVSPLFDVGRLTNARLCPVDRRSHPVGFVRDLASEQLRVLRADLLTRGRRGHRRGGAGCRTWRGHQLYDIVASDDRGDRTILFGRCYQYGQVRAVPGYNIPVIWLRPATARMLQLELGG